MRFVLKNGFLAIILTLLFVNALIWHSELEASPRKFLTVAILDVGQGDSIYIEGPNGGQVLIDGGPNRSVLSELGRIMPFGDTTIDVLVITNPDKDHYGGFLDVLEKFQVKTVIEPGTRTPNATYRELKRVVEEEGAEFLVAERGMSISLGDGAILRVLFPDRDVSDMSRNDGSIISRLEYGSTSVMFTGDTTKLIETYLVNHYPEDLPSTILKVAHHGSKTSTSKNFVDIVSPLYAMISSGKDNGYGHPHQETLDTLSRFGVSILRTDREGTIVFTSDGSTLQRVR